MQKRLFFPLFLFLSVFCLEGTGKEIEQVPLFVSGTGGYDTYRIPALIATREDTLLAFAEGRKESSSDTGDIDLVMRRSVDGGGTWSETVVVWDDGTNTCGNPCPVVDQTTGVIWLLMTHNLGQDSEHEIVSGTSKGSRTVWVCSSDDDGLTWSEPIEITATTKEENWSWYATGPGVGIQLTRGEYKNRMVIPCDHKTLGDEVGYYSHVIYSDDHGATWHIDGITEDGVNECQVVEQTDGTLMLNMRRSRVNPAVHRAISTSSDGGMTWSPLAYDEALPAPRCQASLIQWKPESPVMFFSNPATTSQRIRMTVRMSTRDAEPGTWDHSLLLHEGPSAYSCLESLSTGELYCLYERGERSPYETITLARFTQDHLISASE